MHVFSPPHRTESPPHQKDLVSPRFFSSPLPRTCWRLAGGIMARSARSWWRITEAAALQRYRRRPGDGVEVGRSAAAGASKAWCWEPWWHVRRSWRTSDTAPFRRASAPGVVGGGRNSRRRGRGRVCRARDVRARAERDLERGRDYREREERRGRPAGVWLVESGGGAGRGSLREESVLPACVCGCDQR